MAQTNLAGRMLGDDFKLVKLIGRGGMGEVYKAIQVRLDRTIAIKTLSPEFCRDEKFITRFRREAQAAASLQHPNIVTIYDFGSHGDTYYIAMEYVDGKTLGELLDERGVLLSEQAADLMEQVARGLQYAFKMRFVHRDIKPDNIMLARDGVAKLMDFGLVKSAESDTWTTQAGSILGTPAYMSPEQCDGEELDHRSDIYSLGATFYRCVTGRNCFNDANPLAIMLKHKTSPPTPPRAINPTIPEALNGLLLKMMAKRPEDRYQSPGELLDEIARMRTSDVGPGGKPASPVVSARQDVTFVNEAVRARMLEQDQIDECLSLQASMRPLGIDQGLCTIAIKKDFIGEAEARKLAAKSRKRERAKSDTAFVKAALASKLVAARQLSECVALQKERYRERGYTKIASLLVEKRYLTKEQAVEIGRAQLKERRAGEDAEFKQLLAPAGLANKMKLRQCEAIQAKKERTGQIRLLSDIAVDIGYLSQEQVRDVLLSQLQNAVASQEEPVKESVKSPPARDAAAAVSAPQTDAETIFPEFSYLKLEEIKRCPHCDKEVAAEDVYCPFCRNDMTKSKQTEAERKPKSRLNKLPAGNWRVMLESGKPSRGVSFEGLLTLVKSGDLKEDTKVYGPLTRKEWQEASFVPKLCKYLGMCHNCQSPVQESDKRCKICRVALDRPADRFEED